MIHANIKPETSKYFRKKLLGYAPRAPHSVVKAVRERENYTCQICGVPAKEVDHIIPLRISRDNSMSNLRVLCRKCNVDHSLKRRDSIDNVKDKVWNLRDKEGFSAKRIARVLHLPLGTVDKILYKIHRNSSVETDVNNTSKSYNTPT